MEWREGGRERLGGGGLEEEGGDISVISHFSFEREEIGRGKEWRFAAGMKAMPITKNKICVMEVYNSAGNRRGSQRMRGVRGWRNRGGLDDVAT